eukprot:597738-Prorocentrum_minimum.AAC.1
MSTSLRLVFTRAGRLASSLANRSSQRNRESEGFLCLWVSSLPLGVSAFGCPGVSAFGCLCLWVSGCLCLWVSARHAPRPPAITARKPDA